MKQLRIPATYMRGGTSKGIVFNLKDLPLSAQSPGPARDSLLLRILGGPDKFKKQIDGMGGASSSTSKAVIISKSSLPGHDVNYLFGQVSIDKPFVDWSGNCGNLASAVGPFAIQNKLVDESKIPENGIAQVKIWQENTKKTITAHVPIVNGEVQELGDFELDGVTFPAAEIQLEFLDPSGDDSSSDNKEEGSGAIFPTGKTIDEIQVPGLGKIQATLVNVGIPTVFVKADEIGFTGTELQDNINNNPKALEMLENIRVHGALKMGLIKNIEEAATRQHTPKIAFVAKPADYVASSGKKVLANEIDILVRAVSIGQLHHAMMATAAIAIATSCAIPGTLLHQIVSEKREKEKGKGEKEGSSIVFGHPSGVLRIGAEVEKKEGGEWQVTKAVMSRSARVLMEGWVRVPENFCT